MMMLMTMLMRKTFPDKHQGDRDSCIIVSLSIVSSAFIMKNLFSSRRDRHACLQDLQPWQQIGECFYLVLLYFSFGNAMSWWYQKHWDRSPKRQKQKRRILILEATVFIIQKKHAKKLMVVWSAEDRKSCLQPKRTHFKYRNTLKIPKILICRENWQ